MDDDSEPGTINVGMSREVRGNKNWIDGKGQGCEGGGMFNVEVVVFRKICNTNWKVIGRYKYERNKGGGGDQTEKWEQRKTGC